MTEPQEETPSPLNAGDFRDDIETAISSAVTKHENGMVTKWICVLESLSAEGTRGLWHITSHGNYPWDNLGMLDYAHSLERSNVHVCGPGCCDTGDDDDD